MRKILLTFFVLLVSISLSCKDKDDENNPTKPRPDYTASAFISAVAGKTFNVQEGMYSEFGESTSGAITFDNNALPIYLFLEGNKAEGFTKSVKLYRVLATNKAIYYVKVSNVVLSVDDYDNEIVGNLEMYVGIETQGNGALLYETAVRGVYASVISSSNIEWDRILLSGIDLSSASIEPLNFDEWLPADMQGIWISKTTYTNMYEIPNVFVRWPWLKIGGNKGELLFQLYKRTGAYILDRNNAILHAKNYLFYSDDGYTLDDSKKKLYKIGNNEYVLVIPYSYNSDEKRYSYSITLLNENQIRVNNAKYDGAMYKDLIFEKVTTP